MIKSLVLVLCLLAGFSSFAQFKSEPFFAPWHKPPEKLYLTQRGIIATAVDSSNLTETSFHIATAVGYTTSNQLVAGTGPFILHSKYDQATQKWNTQYGAGVMLWAAGGSGPSLQTPGFAVGPAITVLNGWVTLGGAYDFVNKKYIAMLSLSYSFLN